jgi:hypothetical protein
VDAVNVLARIAEDQKIRVIANFHLKPFFEDVDKEIVGFRKTGVEIAKIKSHFHSGLLPAA